jgi:hypothetical protein
MTSIGCELLLECHRKVEMREREGALCTCGACLLRSRSKVYRATLEFTERSSSFSHDSFWTSRRELSRVYRAGYHSARDQEARQKKWRVLPVTVTGCGLWRACGDAPWSSHATFHSNAPLHNGLYWHIQDGRCVVDKVEAATVRALLLTEYAVKRPARCI